MEYLLSFLSGDIQSVRQIGQNSVLFLQENNAAQREDWGEAVLLMTGLAAWQSWMLWWPTQCFLQYFNRL